MVEKQALNCLSGKKFLVKSTLSAYTVIILVHLRQQSLLKNLIENNMVLMPLNKMKNFVNLYEKIYYLLQYSLFSL